MSLCLRTYQQLIMKSENGRRKSILLTTGAVSKITEKGKELQISKPKKAAAKETEKIMKKQISPDFEQNSQQASRGAEDRSLC